MNKIDNFENWYLPYRWKCEVLRRKSIEAAATECRGTNVSVLLLLNNCCQFGKLAKTLYHPTLSALLVNILNSIEYKNHERWHVEHNTTMNMILPEYNIFLLISWICPSFTIFWGYILVVFDKIFGLICNTNAAAKKVKASCLLEGAAAAARRYWTGGGDGGAGAAAAAFHRAHSVLAVCKCCCKENTQANLSIN